MTYVVALASVGSYEVEMAKVEASSAREAAVTFLRPREGFEEWRWDRLLTLASLQGELAQCDLMLGVYGPV